MYSGSTTRGSRCSSRFNTNFDSKAEFVKTVARESLVVRSRFGASTNAIQSALYHSEIRVRAQIARCHFRHFDHILPEEDLEETNDEYQYSAIEDWELPHKVNTLRNRLRGG